MIINVGGSSPKNVTGFSWDDTGDYVNAKEGFIRLFSSQGQYVTCLTSVSDLENFIIALRRAAGETK